MVSKYAIKPLDDDSLSSAVRLALDEYRAEQKHVNALYDKDYSLQIEQSINDLFRRGKAVMVFKNDVPVGFLGVFIVENTDNEGYKAAFGPVCDYGIKKGADRGRIASLLFQNLSELLLPLGVRHYAINIYAHDKEVIKSLVLNQFGIMCVNEIKNIEVPILKEKVNGCTFKELSKKEMLEHREILLGMWRALANHLQQSPTYYFGHEFTGDAYWQHINDSGTRLFVARNDLYEIVGVVDTSHDEFCFAWSDAATLNVGDLYIEPDYRGKLVAQGLLQFASNVLIQENYKRLWVMHGTGNPGALRFWGKYFNGFVYQLTRSVDKDIVDLYRGKGAL
jgi:GNAT superfamily N-acetyltransferase